MELLQINKNNANTLVNVNKSALSLLLPKYLVDYQNGVKGKWRLGLFECGVIWDITCDSHTSPPQVLCFDTYNENSVFVMRVFIVLESQRH